MNNTTTEIRRFAKFTVRVTDASSPSRESFIPVEVMEVKGGMVKVEALYIEALPLTPKGFIKSDRLIERGTVREGWIPKAA